MIKIKIKKRKKKRNHLPIIIIIVVFILSLVKIPTLQNRKLKTRYDDSITGATNTTTITKPSNLLNKENEIKSSPHSSIWKRAIKLTTSPSVKIDSTESVGELNKQISPINLDTSINDTTTTTTTSLPKTLRNLENNQKKHRHPFSHKI